MLIVISPAKRLDWDDARPASTEPKFLEDANRLAGLARQLAPADLKRLMGLSDALAALNHERFRVFDDTPAAEVTRAAAFAFAGDTYLGLEAATLDAGALRFAQARLRILSGLYGLLRPLDAIQPYRLEMGTRFANSKGKTLYAYWGDRLARRLAEEADALGTGWLLNCASQEYFGAVPRDAHGLRVVTPVFLDEKDGTARTIGIFAKKARGAMARFAIERRLTDPSSLADFDLGGYRLDPSRSETDRPVFLRPQPATRAEAA